MHGRQIVLANVMLPGRNCRLKIVYSILESKTSTDNQKQSSEEKKRTGACPSHRKATTVRFLLDFGEPGV